MVGSGASAPAAAATGATGLADADDAAIAVAAAGGLLLAIAGTSMLPPSNGCAVNYYKYNAKAADITGELRRVSSINDVD